MNTIQSNPSTSNQEFLEKYARPGCIGLAGGTTLIDKAIRRAERRLDEKNRWSQWSHAFLVGERRSDGHLWIIESDLQAGHKHLQFGVQENRMTKYHDGSFYKSLAVLDLDLNPDQTRALLAAALNLVATRMRYSLRELLGAYVALRRSSGRDRQNILARDHSLYCSAFVQHVFKELGIDLVPQTHTKTNTPEDISRTPVPHHRFLLERELGQSAIGDAAVRLRRRVKIRLARSARFLRKKSSL